MSMSGETAEQEGAWNSEWRLTRVGNAFEDRASAVRALHGRNHLPRLFVRQADPQLPFHLRNHVAVNLVRGAAAILDNTGIVFGRIVTECPGGAGDDKGSQGKQGAAGQTQDITSVTIRIHRPLPVHHGSPSITLNIPSGQRHDVGRRRAAFTPPSERSPPAMAAGGFRRTVPAARPGIPAALLVPARGRPPAHCLRACSSKWKSSDDTSAHCRRTRYSGARSHHGSDQPASGPVYP